MRQVYGKIRAYYEKERVFEIKVKNKIEYFYITRSHQKKFSIYLQEDLYVIFNCSDTKSRRYKYLAHELEKQLRAIYGYKSPAEIEQEKAKQERLKALLEEAISEE
jgi:hypothetical protein